MQKQGLLNGSTENDEVGEAESESEDKAEKRGRKRQRFNSLRSEKYKEKLQNSPMEQHQLEW